MTDATIFALASGAGRAGVAVVRLSGTAAGPTFAKLTRHPLPAPRRAMRIALHNGEGQVIDRCLGLWFPGPGSFTGEDVAEFHVHGGRAVLNALFSALVEVPHVRPAEPGEFTRRAFANGKLDLTAAEGLADLVAAETEGQRRQALRQLEGALAGIYDQWRTDLVLLSAEVEAAIDFPEEDLPVDLTTRARLGISILVDAIKQHLSDNRIGETIRDGFSIVILGQPNVGKSTLFNYLAGRDAAIVSAQAGTTRDVIDVRLELAGLPVTVSDTAGLWPTDDLVEQEGIRRAREKGSRADLRLIMVDAAEWPSIPPELAASIDGDSMLLVNKTDRNPVSSNPEKSIFSMSLETGSGLPEFYIALQQFVVNRLSPPENAGITRVRHRQALEVCVAGLERAGRAFAVELMAEDLRLAARDLGRITGQVDVEDILDVLFGEFCIGK